MLLYLTWSSIIILRFNFVPIEWKYCSMPVIGPKSWGDQNVTYAMMGNTIFLTKWAMYDHVNHLKF